MNMYNISSLYLNRFNEILKEMETKMFNQQIVDNITQNFIRCMIPHHEAAIYMCQNLLLYRCNYRLKRLAKNIIEIQTKEINRMLVIERTLVGYKNSNYDVNNYMYDYYKIVNLMVLQMRNSLRSTNINLDFISEMIPHHMGAIRMCQNLLKYNIDPRIEELAKQIIKEQSTNIITLKRIKNSIIDK